MRNSNLGNQENSSEVVRISVANRNCCRHCSEFVLSHLAALKKVEISFFLSLCHDLIVTMKIGWSCMCNICLIFGENSWD